MKKTVCILLALSVLLLSGCTEPEVIATVSTTAYTEAATQPQTPEPEAFSFEQLRFTEFLFSSGAGAWGTTLYISGDGSFSGTYHDSEMGNRAGEYPMGTVYHCGFFGQFGNPEKTGEYTYSLPIQVLRYEQVPDSREIQNGIRYCYTTAFGIEQTLNLLLFAPGTPLEALPLEYRQWVGLHMEESGELPFWGLYNESQQQGFAGCDLRQRVRDAVASAEGEEADIEARLDAAADGTERERIARQRYNCWDVALNQVWGLLERALPEDTLTRLTALQLDWIRQREEAAAQFPDLTEAAMTEADWTKERVYYLLQYLP